MIRILYGTGRQHRDKKNVLPYVVVAGIPTKIVKYLDKEKFAG